jgi:DNA repair protein RecN (Recombination protein N)
MLTELRIRDLGIIAEINLVLGPGMTALTGETGAGKTMLVEAIGLLLGATADATTVRQGAAEASVEGRFVSADGDDEIVLGRVVPANGRSRAYIDGRLATATTLAEEGARLVDLHGQRVHQSLLLPATQRAALDRFGGVDHTDRRAAHARIAEIDSRLAALGGDARARAREIDLLRFQVTELDAANLRDADEDERLDGDEDLLADAQAHRLAAAEAHAALSDDGAAADAIGSALAAVAGRAPFKEVESRLRAVAAEVADVSAEIRDAGERIDDDPARLDEVRARRQLLHELRRKYGDTLAEVMHHHRDAATRLAELEGYEARAAELEAERAVAVKDEQAVAVAIAAARRRAAPRLARAVEQNLRQLAMPRARVEVVVEGPDPGDDVRFLLGANPGEPVLPLSKVASGGELARAMLALRLVLTEAPDTLVFDEVDAGIGGEAALAVGRSLATLGARHQVLVVTHLPQVAAFADHQVAVDKDDVDGRTVARAAVVDGEDRTRELSRMLSGMSESGSARRHASELLEAARAARAEAGRTGFGDGV